MTVAHCSLQSHRDACIMLLGDQRQHRVLGRMYSDDQLFRIIVPKRFTLHAYPPAGKIEAGFSNKFITTSGDIRPDFTDEDIALVLQYRWPKECGDLKASDIDAINNSVRGVGSRFGSGADIQSYNSIILSEYCREILYNNEARRERILSNFKAELHEARKLRAVAVEERFNRTELEVLEYIIITRIHHALSWDVIATSLNRSYRKPAWITSYFKRFDAGLVEEIFQLHALARTTIFEDCVGRDWVKLSSRLEPTGVTHREFQDHTSFSPVTPAAMTLAESQGNVTGIIGRSERG